MTLSHLVSVKTANINHPLKTKRPLMWWEVCHTLYVSQFLKKLTEPSTLLWITVQPPGSCLWSHHTCISRLAFSGLTRYMPLAVWPSSRACRQSLNGPEEKRKITQFTNGVEIIYPKQTIKLRKARITKVCGKRESHYRMKDVVLTAGLTLAAVLRGETAAGCAAKRHIGMRVKGILSAEWWNSSKKSSRVCGELQRRQQTSAVQITEPALLYLNILMNLPMISTRSWNFGTF